MKNDQKNITNTNTLSVCLPHPSNTTNIEHFPLRTVCPINCPVLLECPVEFIPNTKVVRNGSNSTDTPPLYCSGNHDTSGLVLPPPDTLSGNHPEPVVHPQMNSRSEQRALHCVRIPLTFHLSCHASVCICLLFIYCFFPPLIPDSPRCCRRL